MSFKDFPPRQKTMTGDFTKMIEGRMLQLHSGNCEENVVEESFF
ncbi:hypothetical protein [Flavobacterium pectinovorum]|nr:hypothetical protein [Flavobacterium pectinovorum]